MYYVYFINWVEVVNSKLVFYFSCKIWKIVCEESVWNINFIEKKVVIFNYVIWVWYDLCKIVIKLVKLFSILILKWIK